MRVSNKPIIVAILPSLMMVYANADPSENAISNVADSIMLAANSTLAEPGVTGVNDWSYSVASLLAASSATAQDANSSSDQSSNNSSIASSDKADSIQTNNYATLGNRQSGEYVIDENGNKKIWSHRMPFLGQKVINLGYDLPDLYGFAMIGTYLSQALQISDLRVSTGGVGGPYEDVSDFVVFNQSHAERISLSK